MKTYDYIVVGSGCAGAITAQTLVQAGADVAMLDVGVEDKKYKSLIPDKDYLTIRKNEKGQYRYFIGEHGEGIVFGSVSKGAQITPPRNHITQLVDQYIPLESNSFSPLESLGYGGLGLGWGLQCWEFSETDLKRAGLNVKRMAEAYDEVAKRIGISAAKDDAATYTLGKLKTYQPSATMDRNHRRIYEKYTKGADTFKRQGIFVGRTPLALLTKDFDGRRGYVYRDMDFYTDIGESAWRPWVTVNSLRKQTNFTYIGSCLVTTFLEQGSSVLVSGIDTEANKRVTFQCRKLILACGALGSARVVLRSLGSANSRLPVLSNPHSYISCIQPSMTGKGSESHKLGFGQLSYFIDPAGDDSGLSVATSYSYQSLMLFRIMTQVPLDFADARIILRYLMSGLILVIVQHPDEYSPKKYLKLAKDPTSPTGDKLLAKYVLSDVEEKAWDARERQYVAAMRKFGVYALKRVHPTHGSSIHYAGTLPFSNDEKELRLSPAGRLHGTKHIYVSDSSGFNFLPAKGLTFSLMANAHIIAENVLRDDR